VALRAKQVQDFCVFIGPRPVGAKHSGNNLSVKPEIFYPNASPVLFAANPPNLNPVVATISEFCFLLFEQSTKHLNRPQLLLPLC